MVCCHTFRRSRAPRHAISRIVWTHDYRALRWLVVLIVGSAHVSCRQRDASGASSAFLSTRSGLVGQLGVQQPRPLHRAVERRFFGGQSGSDAVLDAAYDAWVAEFPKAAAAGQFLGADASRSAVQARVGELASALAVSNSEVLELVKIDGMVLFAGPADRVGECFKQLVEEVGGREEALNVVRRQPSLLQSSVGQLKGKGEGLKTFSFVAQFTRPFYKGVRLFFSPIATGEFFPKAPNFSSLNSSDTRRVLQQFGEWGFFGPSVLVWFFALAFLSEFLSGGSSSKAGDAVASANREVPALWQVFSGFWTR